MSVERAPRCVPPATPQRGQAALLTVLLLAVGVAAVVFVIASPARTAIQADSRTAAALAQARTALIGYAAQGARPGLLPCPDVDNDGSADSPCGALGATAIGRLPWKTLGLPDLRDGAGECLWYAVSGNFKNSGASAPAVVNSDSSGTLAVSDSTGAAVLSGSNAALAIVFAPGAALPTQDRTPGAASVCGGNNNAASYLDSQTIAAKTFNNATGGGTDDFVMSAMAPGPTDLNDRLMPITRDALMPVVEMRVAREVRRSLQNYFTANQYYPHAAPFPGDVAANGTYRGYLPTGATPACNPPTPDLAPYLPGGATGWFVTDNWQRHMVYAVAPRCTAKIDLVVNITIPLLAPPPACAISCWNIPFWGPPVMQVCQLSQGVNSASLNCNNTTDGTPPASMLTVGGAPVQAIVLPASYHFQSPLQARPCAAITDCLEAVGGSTENIDAVDNYAYVKPVRSAANNDNLVIVAP